MNKFQGREFQGAQVFRFSDVSKDDQYSFVIGFCNIERVKFFLKNESIIPLDYSFLWQTSDTLWWDNEFISLHGDEFEYVYEQLADTYSRDVLQGLIRANLNRNYAAIIPYVTGHQYFNRLTFLHNSDNETFVDCGAFDGDTILQYSQFTDSHYKHIFAFEPEQGNVESLKKKCSLIHNLTLIEKGTWSKECNLEFACDTSGSTVVGTRDIRTGSEKTEIEVTTIDNAVKSEHVTFIKMDIEGSEKEALKGATKTIEQNMPKLAICVYHKPLDIVELYEFMKQFETSKKKYIFYLRQHAFTNNETVLYAIPIDK